MTPARTACTLLRATLAGTGPVAVGLAVLLSFLPDARAADRLLMLFRDKPPYSYVEQGEQKGFLLKKTQQILSRAGIEATFVIMPPKRIFQAIQEDAEPVCSFGWYKIPEREKYAKFSLPMHQDRPHLVLAGPSAVSAVKRHSTLKSLMSDPSLVIAVADGVSYGPELDAMIGRFPGRVDRALVSPLQVARKVAGRRADLMFIDQDDYEYLMQTAADFRNAGMIRISYPDIPAGLNRYILCSRKVSDGVMRRINTAISAGVAR